MTFLTGAHPDTDKSRAADPDFVHAETRTRGLGLILQPLLWVRNQRQFPSCVGHAIAACLEGARKAKSNAKQKVSGVSIWREARRRQGRIERITEGTRIDYALAGLIKRGWDPYRDGEDRDDFEASAQDDLADELFADDKRLRNLKRWRIKQTGASRLEQLEQALATPTFGVVVGMFLRDGFFKVPDSAGPLRADLFGGGRNSHAMRVFGCRRRVGRREFAVQNSWGAGWGGIWIDVNGEQLYRPGCVWVDEKVLGDSDCTHDVHCLEVLK